MTRFAFIFACAMPLLMSAATPIAAQPNAAIETSCGRVPRLILDDRSELPSQGFGDGTPAHRAISARFVEGYSLACADGGVGDVFRDGGSEVRLRNDVGSGAARIHSISVGGVRGLNGVVLRYRFLAADGAVRMPTAEEIRDAIYCRRTSANSSQREPGRCPVD
jgi:hypothetical protein